MVWWENETSYFLPTPTQEPPDLVLERNWDESGLECIVKKISSLDLKMQLVEGFDPSASSLLFYKDHFLQSKEE